MVIKIRKAKVDDIPGIVNVRVKTWQTTYKGIVSDQYLANMEKNRSSAVKVYTKKFESEERNSILVATDEDQVVGFAFYGPYEKRMNQLTSKMAEVYGIYVLEAYQNRGIGHQLMHKTALDLISTKAFNALMVWEFESNEYRNFYTKFGAHIVDKKEFEMDGKSHVQIGYLINDIEKVSNMDVI